MILCHPNVGRANVDVVVTAKPCWLCNQNHLCKHPTLRGIPPLLQVSNGWGFRSTRWAMFYLREFGRILPAHVGKTNACRVAVRAPIIENHNMFGQFHKHINSNRTPRSETQPWDVESRHLMLFSQWRPNTPPAKNTIRGHFVGFAGSGRIAWAVEGQVGIHITANQTHLRHMCGQGSEGSPASIP